MHGIVEREAKNPVYIGSGCSVFRRRVLARTQNKGDGSLTRSHSQGRLRWLGRASACCRERGLEAQGRGEEQIKERRRKDKEEKTNKRSETQEKKRRTRGRRLLLLMVVCGFVRRAARRIDLLGLFRSVLVDLIRFIYVLI